MKTASFGLDIGATTIKAVVLDKGQKGYLLKAATIGNTPPKGMISESPLDQEEMAQAIRKTLTEANITTNTVNIALTENQVYLRVLDMPILSDKELSSAIYWEAEQYIPVPLTTITLDYTVLRRPEKPADGTKMQVLLVGAPTSLLDKYQKVLAIAGLYVATVETEILAAIRALTAKVETPPTLIVNIGAISTSLAIVKNGTLDVVYSVPVGGTAINHAIMSDLGFTMQQAEEYKKTYGLQDKTLGGKLGKATEPILISILNEIKKSIGYYKEKYVTDQQISQVILTGGTAKLPGIDLFFAKNIGVEAVIANPWKILAEQDVPKQIIDNAVDYTIAVGLAMRGYDS